MVTPAVCPHVLDFQEGPGDNRVPLGQAWVPKLVVRGPRGKPCPRLVLGTQPVLRGPPGKSCPLGQAWRPGGNP